MKYLLIITLSLLRFNSSAQFAVVSDKEGYVNVRAEAGTGNKVIDTIGNGHMIFCFEDNGNRTEIFYMKNGNISYGHIYKDRYKAVAGFEKIPFSHQSDSVVHLQKDDIKIILAAGRFEKNKHRFAYHKENREQLELIDGKPYWGLDGGMPTSAYQPIRLSWGGKQIVLPDTATADLFEPSLFNTEAYYDASAGTLYVLSLNSDGAGSYHVIWRIEKGVYSGRLVAYGF